MDPNDDDTNVDERRNHIARVAVAYSAAAVVVAVALDNMTKKKGIAEKLVAPLNNLAAALQSTSMAATNREFAREVNEAVNEMESITRLTRKRGLRCTYCITSGKQTQY